MRFRELDFEAFGPFTNFSLRFADGPGLHVIYGPNESGKSSALRAVRGLLYGIPSGGGDDFLHPAGTLLLRAVLERSDGQTLAFGRRRGRKNTLLNPEGKPTSPDALLPFLAGVEAELFDRLYGLDHRALSDGGNALLAEGGQVGESLFAAGIGPGFRKVRDSLKEEADGLWKPRSSTKVVDSAIDEYNEAQRLTNELSVSAETWSKLSEDLESETRKAETLDTEIRRLEKEKQRLQRCSEAARDLPQRAPLLEELATLETLPDLAEDFSQRRGALERKIAALRLRHQSALERKNGVERELEEAPGKSPLLAFEPRIERLNRRLDFVMEVTATMPQNEALLSSLQLRTDALIVDLGIESEAHSQAQLPDAALRARTRRLAESYRRLQNELAALTSQSKKDSRRLDALASELAALPPITDTQDLEASLRILRMALGQDTEIEGLLRSLSKKRNALDAALDGLSFWSGDFDALGTATVPSVESVDLFDLRFRESSQRGEAFEQEKARLTEKGRAVKEQRERMRERSKVRTRKDLREAREKRDANWTEVCKLWQDGTTFEKATKARTSLKNHLSETDALADALLDNAAEVAKLEQLTLDLESSRAQWKARHDESLAWQTSHEELRTEWESLWDSPELNLRSPAEMKGWVSKRETILELGAELRDLQEQVGALQASRAVELQRQAKRWEGVAQASSFQETFAHAIEASECALEPQLAAVETVRRLETEREQLLRSIAEGKERWESSQSELDAWRAQWEEVAGAYGRDSSADPSDLEGLLDRYDELRSLLVDRQKAQQELAQQAEQLKGFREQVKALCGDVGRDFEAEQAVRQVESLVADWNEAKKLEVVRQHLLTQREELEAEVDQFEQGLSLGETEWGLLLREAGNPEGVELPELEAKVARRRTLLERLERLEESLRRLSGGQALEDFVASLEGFDADAVPGQLQDLQRRLEALETQRAQAWQTKGQLEQKLRECDGAEAASLSAQNATDAMSSGRAAVERYIRLRLAEAVLLREMERYRQDNEGPVLRAASGYFAKLTLGAYSGLVTGIDPKSDTPRLEALASSGRQVAVDGLSDGTRDQLFLALRLATISHNLEHSPEPIPMVMDDVLVHFDTERARATLEVLAEFAQETQVLLFTHLERDKVLAEALDPQNTNVLTLQQMAL